MKLLKWVRRQLDRVNWFYQLRCFLFSRYSTVKPKCLPHTWIDKSCLIVHTMFEILSNFLENECDLQKDYSLGPKNFVIWYGRKAHVVEHKGELHYVMDVMINLYKWYHNEYILYYNDKHPEYLAIHEEWKKWSPEWVFKPIEEKPGYSELTFEYKSEKAKIEDRKCMNRFQAFEDRIQKETMENMHLLVDVKDYMWT